MTNSLLRCACAGLVAVFIGACETDITEHDTAYSHPPTVERKTARLDVGPMYAGKPAPADSERIDEFLYAYQTQGERPLEVTVPGKSTDDPAAREHALQLANALMQLGHDVVRVALSDPTAEDPDILAAAAESERILVTYDRDFSELIFARTADPPPAIIYIRYRPRDVAAVIERLLTVLDFELLRGHMTVLDQQRIRRTPFPMRSNDNG